MPLQVWLPLQGDLTNNGLMDINVTGGTPVWLSDGKLGKCISLESRVTFNSPNLQSITNNAFSVAFWERTDTSTTLTGNWVDILSFDDLNTEKSGSGIFRFEACYGSSLRACSWHNNASYNFTNGSVTVVPDSEKGHWHHICVTIGNGVTSTYRDGELLSASATGVTGGYLQGTFRIGETDAIVGGMNDLRIYDHVLSPKEIKLLSQGLVCHYKLSDPYIEGTTNLCNVQFIPTGTSGGWGGHSGVVTIENRDNAPVPSGAYNKIAITYAGSGGGGWGRAVQQGITASPSTTYTYSCYIKSSIGYATRSVANLLYKYELNSSGTKITEGGVFSSSRMISLGDGWYRCWGTFTTTSTTAKLNINFYTYPDSDAQYLVGCWQLEQNDHMTPYVLGSRLENLIYDCSGYNNHMTAVNSPTITAESPRYSVSTHFTDGQYIIADENSNTGWLPTDSITVNLWTYITTWGNPISCTQSGGWNFEDAGGTNGIRFPIYVKGVGYVYKNSGVAVSSLLNGWHMLTGTFDKTTSRIYIDGELEGEATASTPNIIQYSGARLCISAEAQGTTPASSTMVGNISDVRIYATALSAEDVLALYNTPESIANNGTVITQGEFVEV